MTHAVTREWFPAHQFPTPGMPLVIRGKHPDTTETVDGKERTIAGAPYEVEGVRPNYVNSYGSDPDYRDMKGNRLSGVVQWAHR